MCIHYTVGTCNEISPKHKWAGRKSNYVTIDKVFDGT